MVRFGERQRKRKCERIEKYIEKIVEELIGKLQMLVALYV